MLLLKKSETVFRRAAVWDQAGRLKDAYAYLVLWWQLEDKANLITKKKTHVHK